jgi:hypothetical protein
VVCARPWVFPALAAAPRRRRACRVSW